MFDPTRHERLFDVNPKTLLDKLKLSIGDGPPTVECLLNTIGWAISFNVMSYLSAGLVNDVAESTCTLMHGAYMLGHRDGEDIMADGRPNNVLQQDREEGFHGDLDPQLDSLAHFINTMIDKRLGVLVSIKTQITALHLFLAGLGRDDAITELQRHARIATMYLAIIESELKKVSPEPEAVENLCKCYRDLAQAVGIT